MTEHLQKFFEALLALDDAELDYVGNWLKEQIQADPELKDKLLRRFLKGAGLEDLWPQENS